MYFEQIFPVKMGINLRGSYIRMTEHLLDGTEVGSAFKQVCGKRVPQRMRAYMLLYTGFAAIALQNFPETHP